VRLQNLRLQSNRFAIRRHRESIDSLPSERLLPIVLRFFLSPGIFFDKNVSSGSPVLNEQLSTCLAIGAASALAITIARPRPCAGQGSTETTRYASRQPNPIGRARVCVVLVRIGHGPGEQKSPVLKTKVRLFWCAFLTGTRNCFVYK